MSKILLRKTRDAIQGSVLPIVQLHQLRRLPVLSTNPYGQVDNWVTPMLPEIGTSAKIIVVEVWYYKHKSIKIHAILFIKLFVHTRYDVLAFGITNPPFALFFSQRSPPHHVQTSCSKQRSSIIRA